MSIENRKVTIFCPTCGNDQFSCVNDNIDDLSDAPDDTKLKCSDCGNVITKSELIESNQDIINANIEEVKQEAIKEFEKELKKAFKGAKIKWK